MSNMNNIMMKLFTVALLMMVSLGARAEVKVLFGENGDDVFSGKGGTIEVSQEPDEKDETKVKVYLTFTPQSGYAFDEKTLEVYAVISPDAASTRAPQISGDPLKLTEEKTDVPSAKRYSVDIDSKLALWVKEVNFLNGRKGGEFPEPGYYIRSGSSNKWPSDGDYYICPTENWAFFHATNNVNSTDNGQPFLTTHQMDSGQEAKYKWIIEKHTIDGHDYYAFKYGINYEDGGSSYSRYMSYNRKLSGNNVGVDRMRIHLKKTESPGDYELFDITETTQNSKTYLVISPKKGDEDANDTKKYLVVNGGNTNYFEAYYIANTGGVQNKKDGPSGFELTTGIIGTYYAIADPNAPFYLDEIVPRPTITNDASGNVTITAESGTTIRYTTNGNDPTGSTATIVQDNTVTFSIPDDATAIKAIAVKTFSSGVEVSYIATQPLPAYTYNIVDTEGHIAIKYTVNQLEGLSLSGNSDIPEAIRSPYLEGETVTFYSTFTEGSRSNLSNAITETPVGGGDIYVSYTTDHINDNDQLLRLSGSSPFTIQVNGKYVYDYDSSGSLMCSDTDNGDADESYRWQVKGGDPYRMYIQNVKNDRHYFKWSTDPSASLALTGSGSTHFIIFGGSVDRPSGVPEGFKDQVEFMAATGDDISSNAYYNLGRVSEGNVSLLANDTYGHGHAAIQVLLKTMQKTTTFHIIDMSGRIVVEQSGFFDALDVPSQWKSPLVQTYHFYEHNDFRVHDDVYTLRSGVTEIPDFDSAPADIYVTYEPNDNYDLDGSENRATDGKKYLLKFAGGTKFRQEKSDGFETTPDEGIYPYINGEGGLFVYGEKKLEAQANDVASTRTRWVWYLEGGDPYRLRIASLQTRTDGVTDDKHYSYLRTYKPQGYTEVVTGAISNNSKVSDGTDGTDPTGSHDARHKPTDYMILNGTNGHFKLVTSDVVDDYDNETVDVRHTVTSFENYWKTNPTAINVVKAYYNDETIYKDGEPTEEQKTAALVTGQGWHSYNAWARARTWTRNTQVFEYGEHWFKTIGVGTETETQGVFNGDFDLEEYDLDGALILLDKHGWEVMRKPITNLSTKKEAYATELRKYDSPMVRKYHFWTNFKKEDGYHKYKPTRGVSSSKDAKEVGTGTSLSDYPEVFSTGTLADIYVTYEVMATYRDGYKCAQTTGGLEASKYLVRQGDYYAKTTDGANITPVDENGVDLTDPSSIGDELLWYLKPNINIDTEMGYRYSGNGNSYEEKSQADTELDYYNNRNEYYVLNPPEDNIDHHPNDTIHDPTNGQNGFDPYNLQIESVAQSGKLFTTNATDAVLDGIGGMESTYTDSKIVTLQDYGRVFDASDYYNIDKETHTGYQMLHVTNSTFMAVSDFNGNIRLMPRFDHHNVQTSLTALDEQGPAKPYGDEDGTQTTLFVLPSTSSQTPSGDPITVSSSDEITDMNGYYLFDEDKGFDVTKVIGTKANPFRGTIDGQLITIDGLSRPLVAYAEGATIKNVIVKTVSINAGNADGNAGAICCEATDYGTRPTRIYNCGVLPTTTERDEEGNITGFSGSHVTGSANVGGIIGQISGTTRVINCYSYATVSGGSMMGGIVGNNTETSTMSSIKTIVVNCMFYGEISGGSPGTAYPVYGGTVIENSGTTAINNYNYYRGESTFDDGYTDVAHFNRSWPAEEQNLTRFEYYRSILNSNRKLCTWWVNGTASTAPTDADVSSVGIAKWVLDPSIAPYPILKRWGKYSSIINPDPEKVWNTVDNQWVQRTDAAPYQGRKLGELTIKVKTGSYPGTLTGLTEKEIEITRIVTDMDTLNYDYCYGKVQLPYYNEVFGNPSATDHLTRYYGNYTSKAVTAWKITSVTDDGRTRNSFVKNWENGYNYADRNCTAKDLYDDNDGRAFAQGGYYYVPEGVTKIEIEAYWGTAFYLHGKDHYLDRVNVTNSKNYGTGFTPAGTLGNKLKIDDNSSHDISIYENFTTLMSAVKTNKTCNVYDQAVVLVGNYPLHAQNDINMGNSGQGGFTIMSADFDMDNEPDFCFPLQWRSNYDRRPIMPVRFDFLPIPELGLAMRHNTYAYAIGIFVPQGHFEITETSFMHTTQFEYMSPNANVNINHQQPLIFNGGEFEQIVCHGNKNVSPAPSMTHTRNIILGGHVWMLRFTPGSHTDQTAITRHCAVSVMGGEFPEFYLTGVYKTTIDVSTAYDDNPHCYTNGGRFGIMAGAGMEAVKNSVYIEIDHSIIDEFYGGGINSNNPVNGDIHVTINNSLVLEKYCGGPKVGSCETVTTNAEGTVFNQYFGGGNGGTNLFRQQIADKTPDDMPNENAWRNANGDYKYNNFTPISDKNVAVTYNASYGYHAEYEFEVFNQSNGINKQAVARTYYHWAQFGTTQTGAVTNKLKGCTVKSDYYSAGNLGNVNGTVESTLTDCTLLRNAFGAGFSASIPHFPVHNKDQVTFPYRDKAGVCHNGKVEYRKDGTEIRQYTWCYKNPTTNVVTPAGVEIPAGVSTSKPAFQDDEGNWYCYTTVSLENLGSVTGNVTLTLDGNTVVGTEGDPETGNVYGGGDASAVGQLDNESTQNVDESIIANTTINLQGNTRVLGNVFGGGNDGLVNGSATVNIRPVTPTTPTPSPSRASGGSGDGEHRGVKSE